MAASYTFMRAHSPSSQGILTLVLSLLSLWSGSAGHSTNRPECRLSYEMDGVAAGVREGVQAVCDIRTLRSELLQPSHNLNSTLSAVNRSLDVTSLTLRCSKQVVFQSELQPAAFSAFPRLAKLSIVYCKLKDLPGRTFAGLSELRELTINTYHLDWPGAALTINPDTLTELPRLERLDLSSSELWHLPQDSLCSTLLSLNTVNLTNNKLHRISDIGLDERCYSPIAHLFLSNNEIDEIPSGSLPLSHLHTLKLDHNKLARIDDNAFSDVSELRELILSYNKLVAIPKAAFYELQQLRSLDLANNSLTSLPPTVFGMLQQLLSLNISHNQISFSSDVQEPFMGCIRLVVLDLSYNHITSIGDQVFHYLYFLQALFLSHNKISYLNEGVFSSLANLYTLDLSFNSLSTLDSGALKGLSVLTHLSLNNNSINGIADKSFYNCSSLQKLSLSHNNMTRLPKAITYLTLLQDLDLSHNKIGTLDQTNIKTLSNLKQLSLSHNNIGNISVDMIPKLPKLEYLNLSFNKIKGVENKALEPLTELLTLDLSNNYLPDMYGMVALLFKLQYLNVSRNNIEWFDYALIPVNLQVLDMSYNKVKVLENHFEVHGKLRLSRIIVSFNNITEISSSSIPNSVKYVDLSHNQIDFVSSNTFLLKDRVDEINLESNLLTLLEESSLRLPPRSPDAASAAPPLLLLSNNPLKCDCGAEWLSRAARDANGVAGKMSLESSTSGGSSSLLPRLADVAQVMCTLAGLWNNVAVPLVSVEQHQFLCTYRRHCFTLCHCCEFDACDCEQTCPDNCNCYHDQFWRHNIVDCGKQNWTTMPLGVPMDVTQAFLDGNNMGNLTSHALIGRKNLKTLYLNNSNIIDIQNRTFNGLQNLEVLRLDHNHLKRLRAFEFILLHNLLELYLNDNKIAHISNTTFTSLRALEVLRLENNKIVVFPVWNLGLNPFLVEVGLYNNRWSCECNFLANLKAWLESNRIKAARVKEVMCYYNRTGEQGPAVTSNSPHCDHHLSPSHIEHLIVQDYIMFTSISLVVLVFVVVLVLVAVYYRRPIKLWAASQYTKHLFAKSSNYLEEREKLFDVFISHSNKDSAWVYGVLAPELESQGYRTCAAYRNCSSPTAPIVAQALSEGIACSQRLLLVISSGFVDCEWCKYDYKSTHMDAVNRMSKKELIIVNLENVPKTELDSELSTIVRKSSYSLRPRDPRFWERLRRALPSLRHKRRYDEALGKSISSPLMSTNVPPSDTIKFSATAGPHPAKNLTLNPYWETAMTCNIPEWNMKKPDLGAPPWVEASPIKATGSPCSPRPAADGAPTDHTYMSVSECGESNIMTQHPSEVPGPSGSSVPTNITTVGPNYIHPGQSSPPLLSLHHQHLVHHQLTSNNGSLDVYQTPHGSYTTVVCPPVNMAPTAPSSGRSPHGLQAVYSSVSGPYTSVMGPEGTSVQVPLNSLGNIEHLPRSTPQSSRGGEGGSIPPCSPQNTDSVPSSRGDNHFRWIYQTPPEKPSSSSCNGQTYYV